MTSVVSQPIPPFYPYSWKEFLCSVCPPGGNDLGPILELCLLQDPWVSSRCSNTNISTLVFLTLKKSIALRTPDTERIRYSLGILCSSHPKPSSLYIPICLQCYLLFPGHCFLSWFTLLFN